jgi:SnoaL-like domain
MKYGKIVTMNNRIAIINNYIAGYNEFDVEKMVQHFADAILFENIQQGEVTMVLNGLQEFRLQAEQAKSYFSARKQTITSFSHNQLTTEITLEYQATLDMDFPNGLKKGRTIHLTGQSIFEFEGDKIIKLTDIS